MTVLEKIYERLRTKGSASDVIDDPHTPSIAIHLNDLAVLELMGYVGNTADARLSIFPRYQCAVLKLATDFQDHGGSVDEERRPSRVGGNRDQNIARFYLFFEWIVEYFDGAGGHARGYRRTNDGALGLIR